MRRSTNFGINVLIVKQRQMITVIVYCNYITITMSLSRLSVFIYCLLHIQRDYQFSHCFQCRTEVQCAVNDLAFRSFDFKRT
jgi:hypothetical protein